MDADYCVLCQEDHQMIRSCLLNVQCKRCGMRGHLRIDCSAQDLSSKVELEHGDFSVQQGGILTKEEMNQTKSGYTPETQDNSVNQMEDCGGSSGQGIKRKKRTQVFYSPPKSVKSMSELVLKTDNPEPAVEPPKISGSEYFEFDEPKAILNSLDENIHDDIEKYKVPSEAMEPEQDCLEDKFKMSCESKKNLKVMKQKGCKNSLQSEVKSKHLDEKPQEVNCGSISSQEGTVRQGVKRKSGAQVSSCPPKTVKFMSKTSLKTDDPEPAAESHKIPGSEYNVPGSLYSKYSDLIKPKNVSQPEVNSNPQDKKVNLQLTKQKDWNNNMQSEVKSKHKDKKSPELKAGTYNIISIHMELFRSNKSSSTKLTQIGCVVSGSNPSLFFKAIKPCGIEKYLDNYKLGGDVLQALHMTREDDGTFLFRSRYETVEKKAVCIEEGEALKSFLNFLESFPNCVLLGVDEDTVSILEKKLKDVDEEKFNNKVKGFTYWKRVLKYLDVDGYKNIDLEEYCSNMIGEDLPSYTTALDIASVLLKSVNEVTSKEKAGMRSLDSHFYKLCKRIECIDYPRKFDYDRKAAVENVEVFSSFRPSVSATFSADKLEQVTLSSESDSELEVTRRSNTRRGYSENKSLKKELNEDLDVIRGLNYGLKAGLNVNEARSVSVRALLRRLTPTVNTVPRMSDSWQIGKPTVNEGTVVCPKCTAGVRYSKISKHLKNSHQGVDCLLCPFCKSLVSPSDVPVHMPKCSASPAPACQSKESISLSKSFNSDSSAPGLSVKHIGQPSTARVCRPLQSNQSCTPKEDMVVEELYKLGVSTVINFAKYENIPVSVTGPQPHPQPIAQFSAAGLRPLLMENVTRSGYWVPTPVQQNAIPIIMAGRDLMACAQTGSGKTAAFLLPIIHKLISSQADAGIGSTTACPQAIIIAPTMELALQIYHEALKLAQGSMIKPVVVAYGNNHAAYQAKRLVEGCNILVATPGKLLYYVDKRKVSFRNLQFMVLDEADWLLDMGYMPSIQKCVKDPNMPEKGKRQTLMFSSNFPDDIQTAAQEFLYDYLFLSVGLVGDVEHTFHEVAMFDKKEKLEELLNEPARDSKEKTLIFVQTRKNAKFLASHLSQKGFPTTSSHSDKLQRKMKFYLTKVWAADGVFHDFRLGSKPILVVTDEEARGLNIPGVAHVINYDMPEYVNDYINRMGRTGHDGNFGKATSFYDTEQDTDVAGPLVQMLSAKGIAVPEWLEKAGKSAEVGCCGGDEDWG